MPLNVLTLASSQGLIDRPFKQLVGGLTAGTELRVSSGNAGGFYMQGDFLCNDSLELGAQGVTILERSLTEERSTTLTVTAQPEYAVKAGADAQAGGSAALYRVYPVSSAAGVSWEYAYYTSAGNTRVTRLNSGGNIFNLKAGNVARFKAAMARTDRNTNIACIGPSTTGGQTTGGGGAQAVNSWPMQTAAILQAQGVNAGANNAYPDKSGWGAAQTAANYMAGDARIVLTGGAAPLATKTVGGNAITMTAAAGAGSIQFTPQAAVTKFDIWWRDNGTGRTFSWAIDGGAATNVSSTGAATPQKTTVSAGAAGIHALTIARVAGDVTILGINAYDDTGGRREISFLNWGISGGVSARFLDATDAAGGNIAMWAAQTPDIAILDDWPINDWRQSVALATFKTNLTAGVARQKLYGDVIITTPIWDSSTSGLSPQQDAYAAACYEVAIEQDVPLIDVRAAWVSFAAANADGRYSDTVHPSFYGYTVKARTITEAIHAIRAM